MGFICLFDDLLRFFAGKTLLSLELELLKLAVLLLWVHKRTLNKGSGGCGPAPRETKHRYLCTTVLKSVQMRSDRLQRELDARETS